ncbi:MAG: hypothetical protein P8P91_11660 [Pseudomonadales bacterium]|nr:hypothetical protein [Pseudomonadales bacterium]
MSEPEDFDPGLMPIRPAATVMSVDDRPDLWSEKRVDLYSVIDEYAY